MEVKEQLVEFIIENYLYGEKNGFGENTSLREEGLIDSTGILELITFIEEAFEIKIEDDEIVPENLDTVNLIVDFIEKKKSGKETNKLQFSL